MTWKNLTKYPDDRVFEALGYLPVIVTADGGKIKDQINAKYAHGGGYSPFGEGKWKFDPQNKTLKYPGDSPLRGIAELQVGDELLIFFDHAICCVAQSDGSFDVVRMD